jgi:hypothetical protein
MAKALKELMLRLELESGQAARLRRLPTPLKPSKRAL